MQTASKKVINGWAMYDWANSVYNLVITTTFFPAYYAAVTATTNEKFKDGVPFLGRTFVNTELKDYFFSAAYIVIIFLSPILSSIADYKGNKKAFMRFFCYLGATCCSLMFFFDGDNVLFGLFMLMLACIGFYGSQVFYNSYLPEIAAEADQNRVSARGYTFGYIGSVLMQLIGFGMVLAMP
ncbi:MAG TPA: MFS transporter, partial [Chitinophagaceae bacterium]|nr:MFS transporter [Chitinophagaceae bacterium]